MCLIDPRYDYPFYCVWCGTRVEVIGDWEELESSETTSDET